MTQLPDHIRIYFFNTLKGDVSLEDFEKWVYLNIELESILAPDDHLDLISLNYKKKGAKHDLLKLIQRMVDLSEYETFKILTLLEETKKKDEKMPYHLMEFYDLYCKGYYFFQDIGLGYGLSIEVPSGANSWDKLSKVQQERLLESFSPGLEIEVQRLIDWLTSKKIILTGVKDEYGHYQYHDYRSKEEKKSLIWIPTPLKKWWKFW